MAFSKGDLRIELEAMITTEFWESASKDMPLPEHPNPQFQRDLFLSLNGLWDFEISQDELPPSEYTRQILVPFAVETLASGIQETVSAKDVLHYRKRFFLPSSFASKRVLLHFEAVDQICSVTLNGRLLGTHAGGYLPFSFDITDDLAEENELIVTVKDDVESDVYPRGKQAKKGHGIWYTPTSGIYQTVWLEAVHEDRVESISMHPDPKTATLSLDFSLQGNPYPLNVRLFDGETLAGEATIKEGNHIDVPVALPLRLWSPEEPNLYRIEIAAKEDRVHSYCAFRTFGKAFWHGHPVFALNGKPYFLKGVLDQGYAPESGLTPVSEEAMVHDIRLAKEYGFNMIRKHIKVEPMRWYALCDSLGIIVFQDFINGGGPYSLYLMGLGTFLSPKWDDKTASFQRRVGRKNPASREEFRKEFIPFIRRFQNVPSLAGWTIFNEAWGQFDSDTFLAILRQEDPTRLIDQNSGWCDQGNGDFDSHHIYFRKVRLRPSTKRILSLSEFGGFSLSLKDHSWSKRVFGYKRFRDISSLNSAIEKLFDKEIIPAKEQGLSLIVYTQLTDVEEETNGLVTYDRKVQKVDPVRLNLKMKELDYDD